MVHFFRETNSLEQLKSGLSSRTWFINFILLSGQKSHYLLLVVNEVNPMIVHPLSVIYLFYNVTSRLILFKS